MKFSFSFFATLVFCSFAHAQGATPERLKSAIISDAIIGSTSPEMATSASRILRAQSDAQVYLLSLELGREPVMTMHLKSGLLAMAQIRPDLVLAKTQIEQIDILATLEEEEK